MKKHWLMAVTAALVAPFAASSLLAKPQSIPAGGSKSPLPAGKAITAADCTADKLGMSIPVSSIGEPVSSVTLAPPVWHQATDSTPAYCSVDGTLAPVDTSATAKPIQFRIALPASWNYRSAQLGGGGMDGTVPNLLANPNSCPSASLLQRGFATYGSDSGHQAGGGAGRGAGPGGPPPAPAVTAAPLPTTGCGQAPPMAEGRGTGAAGAAGRGRGPGGPVAGRGPAPNDDWALNEESIANFGYMQLKKTHDAAIVLIEREYGERPRYSYFFGTSQGGREAMTAAQRYPVDYDGIAANVPVVGFSTLALAPSLIRIQEKPLANYVSPVKANAIRTEIVRQCDGLDGLMDGIINNYMACRAIFDVTQGAKNRNPWSAKLCPNNTDPNPQDTSAAACLTKEQSATLEMIFSPYKFSAPLANGVKSFGMWLPTTDVVPLLVDARYKGQEGAANDAMVYGGGQGGVVVTGFLMKNLMANPLDYAEGGPLHTARSQVSELVDSTNPDLTAFYKHGGKLIVAIGSNDIVASPGAQTDYFQAEIGKMGQAKVNTFARFFVLPQTSHGLNGTSFTVDGSGKTIEPTPIPNSYDRVGILMEWVERNKAPGNVTVTAGTRSLPLCTYPSYPKYVSGPVEAASSYICAAR